jgi:hypothetical protein
MKASSVIHPEISMNRKLLWAGVAGLALAVLIPPRGAEAADAVAGDERVLPLGESQSAGVLQKAAAFAPAEHLVHSTVLTPPTPNTVAFGSDITVTASYKTTEPSGVLIFFQPMTGAKLTPNYNSLGSSFYSAASGTATTTFHIVSGNSRTRITRVRCEMWNANQTTLLYRAYIPVNWRIR